MLLRSKNKWLCPCKITRYNVNYTSELVILHRFMQPTLTIPAYTLVSFIHYITVNIWERIFIKFRFIYQQESYVFAKER